MSITYKLFDDVIIYPPTPGDPGGPCHDEHCGHYDCHVMRKDAAKPCPTCVQPAGYGNAMHMNAIFSGYPAHEDTGFRKITNEHEACYQERLARERADAEAQAQQDAAASDALADTDAQGEALAAGERELDE